MKKQLNKLAKSSALVIITLAAICTNGYAQSNDLSVCDTTQNTALEEEEYEYFEVVQIPEFPGGERALRKFIAKNLNYPEEAKSKKIEGKVYVNFVVSQTGDVKNVKVMRSIDPLLDNEAIRIVQSMPKWKPAKQRRKPVDCSFTIPIVFSLGKKK